MADTVTTQTIADTSGVKFVTNNYFKQTRTAPTHLVQ